MHTLSTFLSTRLPLLFPEGKHNLAYALIQAGIKPQDRVAFIAPNM